MNYKCFAIVTTLVLANWANAQSRLLREWMVASPSPTMAAMAASRDGRFLATCENGSSIEVWDLHNNTCVDRVATSGELQTQISFLGDSYRLVFIQGGHQVAYRDVETGVTDRLVDLSDRRAFAVAASPDSTRLFVTSIMGNTTTVKVIDAASGILISAKSFGGTNWSRTAFSPDSKTAVWCGHSDRGQLFDVVTGLHIKRLDIFHAPSDAAFTPDQSKLILTSDDDTRAVAWPSLTELWKSDKHGETLSLSEDGSVICAGGDDGRFENLRTSDGTRIGGELRLADYVCTSQTLRGGDVAVADMSGNLHILPMSAHAWLPNPVGSGLDSAADVKIDHSSGRITIYDEQGRIVRMFATGEIESVGPRLTKYIAYGALAKNADRLAIPTDTNHLDVFDTNTYQLVAHVKIPGTGVSSIELSPNGEVALSTNAEFRRLVRYDLVNNRVSHRLEGGAATMKVSPTGRFVAGGLLEKTVIYDTTDLRLIQSCTVPIQGLPQEFAWSEDERMLATRSHNGKLVFIDVAMGTVLSSISLPVSRRVNDQTSVHMGGFTRDGRFLAMHANGHRLLAVDPSTGTILTSWGVPELGYLHHMTLVDDDRSMIAFRGNDILRFAFP